MQNLRIFSVICLLVCNFSVFAQKEKLKNKVDSVKYELKCIESDNLLIKANLEKNKKNYTQALELYYNALKLNAANSVAYYEIAQIYKQQFKYNDALKIIQKAIKISPKNIDYLKLLADLYESKGEYDKQMEILQGISKNQPKDLNFQYEIVEIYINRGEQTKALHVLDQIEQEFGSNEYLLITRYSIFYNLHDYDKAEKYVLQLITYSNNDQEYVKELVRFYYNTNKYDKVLSLCDSLDKNNTNISDLKIYKAKIYSNQNNLELLQNELFSIFGDLYISQYDKTEIVKQLILQNNSDTIFNNRFMIIENILKKYPGNPFLHRIIADNFLSNNNKNEALPHLYFAINDNKPAINTFNQIIDIESVNKNWDSVISICNHAKVYFPNNPELYISQGEAYFELDLYDSAINVLNEGLEIAFLKKQKKILYFDLGKACLYANLFEDSENNFIESLKIDSTDTTTKLYYALCLAFQKEKILQAKQVLEQTQSTLKTNDLQYFITSLILYQEGKNNEAVQYIENNKENISTAGYYEYYGDMLFLTNKESEAINAWLQANQSGSKINIQRKKLFLQKK